VRAEPGRTLPARTRELRRASSASRDRSHPARPHTGAAPGYGPPRRARQL